MSGSEDPKHGRSDLQAQGQGGPGHTRRVVPCSEDGQWDTLPRVLGPSRPKRVPGGNPLDVRMLLSTPTHTPHLRALFGMLGKGS